jgi:hypothetical protein
MQRRPPVKDDAHRKFIGGLPCIVCRNNIESQAAHISYSDPKWGKPGKGMASKASDFYCVPLCGRHHDAQHAMNERDWWKLSGIDPIPIAMALYLNSGNQQAGEEIINSWACFA